MPDFSGSESRNDSWFAAGSPDAVLKSLVAAAEQQGGRVTTTEADRVEIHLGSRIAYRLLGVWSPLMLRPMNLRIRCTQTSPGFVNVAVKVSSDQGWFIFQMTRLVSKQFDKAFKFLFALMREAASPQDERFADNVAPMVHLLEALDELNQFLKSSGEDEQSQLLERARSKFQGGNGLAGNELLGLLAPSGSIGSLVVQFHDGSGLTGRSFSEANRRLHELTRRLSSLANQTIAT